MDIQKVLVLVLSWYLFAASPGLLSAQTSSTQNQSSLGICVKDYGAKGDGAVDDTNAIRLAASVASNNHSVLYFPPGNFQISGTITVTSGDIVGAGVQATFIHLQTPIGSGNAAIQVSNSLGNLRQSIRDFTLLGPDTYNHPVGSDGGVSDGIAFVNNVTPYVERVRIQGFRNGEVFNNNGGHIYNTNVTLTQNYYGAYVKRNNSDYYFLQCDLTGNFFASLATPSDQGFSSMTIRDTHLGFEPVGIYQESSPAAQGNKAFLHDVRIDHARFESIGNAAIRTDAQFDSGNKNAVYNLIIDDPGFSWGDYFQIPGMGRQYAVYLPLIYGYNSIQGQFTQDPSGVGIYNAQQIATGASLTIVAPIVPNIIHFGLSFGTGLITLGGPGAQKSFLDTGVLIPAS